MIAFVLESSPGVYFKAHRPEWNHGCGGEETTTVLDDAAVFRAEYVDGEIKLVDPPSKPEKGDWTARAVQFHLKE